MKKKSIWKKGKSKIEMNGSYSFPAGGRIFILSRKKKNGKPEREVFESWEKAKNAGWVKFE